MGLPLEGIKVIDFTGVQAGSPCCQHAGVVRRGSAEGRTARDRLRHATAVGGYTNLDALYFTMLNRAAEQLLLRNAAQQDHDRR
jgi:crotonobetainyl-CoA:carnitine CoA-transferase CaiB-like acyl-CoA transferase